MRKITKIAKKRKNKNLEISADIAATDGSPSRPAMTAMIRKMNANFNIVISFLQEILRTRSGKERIRYKQCKLPDQQRRQSQEVLQ